MGIGRPLVAIVGPTGAGKTSLALDLAQNFNGEIINCDSLQLYRGLDIGTAKTPVADRRGVPHHLFDVLGIEKSYSAGEYARAARQAIGDIADRNRLPILVGGTGFYLKALLEGLPELPERDPLLRARLLVRENAKPRSLHRLLTRLSPAAATRIHAQDTQKLLRALEIRLLTGRSHPLPSESRPLTGYTVVKLGLDPDRAFLHQRLETRTKMMFDSGLLDEVRVLLAAGATGAEKPFESLGYKQALLHLNGELDLNGAITSTLVQTRQYAKRQMTWFRRDPDVIWFKHFGDSGEVRAQATALLRDCYKKCQVIEATAGDQQELTHFPPPFELNS